MASVFTHAVVGLALGRGANARSMPPSFWFWAGGLSMLPDADVVGFALGIRYGDPLGHRGFSHSLLFAAVTGLAVVAFGMRREPGRFRLLDWWNATVLAVITASHGLLDALTDGGRGVGFFIPFDNARYFLPWRPLVVSPIGAGSFFGEWGVRVMRSEILLVWLPVLGLLGAVELTRRLLGTASHATTEPRKHRK